MSSTNMKEATWITYSMNVKMDGQNACRLTDKLRDESWEYGLYGGYWRDAVQGVGEHDQGRPLSGALQLSSNSHPANPKDKKSYSLERKLEQDPKWAASGITFTTPYKRCSVQ